MEAPREPEKEADRGADGEGEEIALGHAHERVEGEAADALIHLAVLEEGLEDVALRLQPGLPGRGQVGRHRLADHGPEEEHGGQAKERQQKASPESR